MSTEGKFHLEYSERVRTLYECSLFDRKAYEKELWDDVERAEF
jgi:hypothetical protein